MKKKIKGKQVRAVKFPQFIAMVKEIKQIYIRLNSIQGVKFIFLNILFETSRFVD